MFELTTLQRQLAFAGEDPNWASYILRTQQKLLKEYGLQVVLGMLRGGARGLNPDNPLAVEANYAGGGDVLDVEFFNVVSSLPPEIIKELKSCKDFTLYLQCYLNMDLGRAREVVAEISKMGMGHYIIQGYIKEYEIES